MNNKVLPPKRFQDPGHPYFDPIRHEGWFGKLMKRRAKNDMLYAAFRSQTENQITQKAAADIYGLDTRELRDYINWVNKTPRKAISVTEQAILDGAYEEYCSKLPAWAPINRQFPACIRHVASLFGVKGRHIEELWEVHPGFWPTSYPIPPV